MAILVKENLSSDEMCLFIGERLFPHHLTHRNQKRTFPKWLISNLDAVEREMAELGYSWNANCNASLKKYSWVFIKECNTYWSIGRDTKAEALIAAAYEVLKNNACA